MDCTEAQCFTYTFILFTAVFGDALWSFRLPIIQVELRLLAFVICVSGSMMAIANLLATISKGGAGKHGSSVAVRNHTSIFVVTQSVI
jgi:hypothetical protein